ncbi:MAG: CaiB/BaiF CoA transferase family protein [Peptococcaceae bacterium]
MQITRTGPLKNIRVLELTNTISGSFAGSLLADYGADVIKVELPGSGDPLRKSRPDVNGESLRWPTIARNKRSISLDLQAGPGKEIFLSLLKTTDIVIENFRDGRAEKCGIDYNVMNKINPRVILIRTSGYSETDCSFSLSDYIAGLFGVIGGLSSLTSVLKCSQKEGQIVDVSLYDPLVRLLDGVINEQSRHGKNPPVNFTLNDAVSPSDIFRTKDDKWIVIAASTQIIWERLAEVMKRGDLISNEKFENNQLRVKNNDLLVKIVGKWVQGFTLEEICRLLDINRIPAAPVNRIADIGGNEELRIRQDTISIEHPGLGKINMPNIFPFFSKTPCTVRHAGPALGEHNREVYRSELDISEVEYELLQKLKVI